MGYPTGERPMRGVHGIPGVTGGTLPAEMWRAYMTAALRGEAVEQFQNPGSPPYHPWCGRYEFARTWRDARKPSSCRKKKSTKESTTQRKTVTVETTTATTRTRTTRPGTTAPPPTTTAPPPTTTTEPTTTASTTSGPP